MCVALGGVQFFLMSEAIHQEQSSRGSSYLEKCSSKSVRISLVDKSLSA
jgi:hypothetical protein